MGESIKAFNLRFTKFFNRILEIIRPQNQAAMIHYDNTLPPIFRNCLEDKNITKLFVALQACLEYEEHAMRTRLPLNDQSKNPDMSTFLQLMQDIKNQMISFKQRIHSFSSSNNSSLLQYPIQQLVNQTHTLMTRPFCNFCEEHHDPKRCEVLKTTKERLFGK